MAKKEKKIKQNKPKPTIPRGLWYGLLAGAIVTFVCAMFLIIRWSLNAYFVAEAEKGRYHYGIEKTLSTLNFPDGYVVWYNIGNYHYQNGDFEKAEEDYYRAIEAGIPYGKECPDKVNLALAMIEQITDEEWDAFFECEGDEMTAEARKVEKTLITARTILIEDGCAHEDDEDGHYKDAQTLKDEIDELLNNDEDENDDEDEDEDQDNEDDENDDQDNNDDGGDGGDQDHSSREDDIMDHLQEQKEEAQQERAEEQQFYENYYGIGSEGDDDSEGGNGEYGESGEIW